MPMTVELSATAKNLASVHESPLRVTEVIRKLRGGSQSKLVRCEDGCLYVLKCFPNPQGTNILANEWIGSAIVAGLDIVAPQAVKVNVSAEVINAFEAIHFELATCNQPPPPGIHFATRLIGKETGVERPRDYLPRDLFQETENTIDYLQMRLLDLWANMQDTRQFVWVRAQVPGHVRVFFIDHGHMFGGPEWCFGNTSKCAKLSRFQMLSGVGWSLEAIHNCICKMEDRIPALLSKAIETTPRMWYQGDTLKLEGVLLARLDNLRQLSSSQGLG